MKKVMPFVQAVKTSLAQKGPHALDLSLAFDEKATLERSLNYLTRSLEVRFGHFNSTLVSYINHFCFLVFS